VSDDGSTVRITEEATGSVLTRCRRVAARMLKFGAIGASGIAVNTVALWLMVDVAGLHYLAGAALATQLSTAWNFILTDTVLYRRHRQGRWVRRFVPFALVNNLTLLLRLPLLALLVDVLAVNYLIGNILVLSAIFVGRFIVCDRFLYRVPDPRLALEATEQTAPPTD
jgi:dolichol-phosphate mannosyltransferase